MSLNRGFWILAALLVSTALNLVVASQVRADDDITIVNVDAQDAAQVQKLIERILSGGSQ